MEIRSVTIIGVGLIGGSFALALKRAGYACTIRGVDKESAIREAIQRNAIDEGISLRAGVAMADLVYLAAPIRGILETLESIQHDVSPSALVTDAGSTKQVIVSRAEAALRQRQFLGGHPIAGKESSGVASADARLFQDKIYVLTPLRDIDLEKPRCVDFIQCLKAIGAKPCVLRPAEHDRIVSYTSHLGQLASTALAATALNAIGVADHLTPAGPGLLDMTRLALSSYDMWEDILTTNSDSIANALDAYITFLSQMRETLCQNEMRAVFESGKWFATSLRHS